MRAVSDAWNRTMAGSHTPVFQAIVCDTYQSTTSPTGTTIPILAGDVTLDGSAKIRSTVDLTTDAATAPWPTRAADLLAPYGNEVYICRGIQYSDALVEWVGLGYHRIQTPEQDEAPRGTIRIAARDRMAGIIDGRLLKPRQFGTTASLGYIVSELVGEVYPDAVIVWDDDTDDTLLTRPAICEDDRYAFLDDLIRSQGKIWYWDHAGQLTVKSPPDPTTPVATISAGRGGQLVRLDRRLTRDGVYNAVVAQGEAIDFYTDPVRGVAYDNNPSSPTYYHGRFGPVPTFYTSPFIYSPRQARDAARAILQRHLGLPYSIDLAATPNPALEPWDPTWVDTSDGRREKHLLDVLTIPLTAEGAMAATSREQSTILIGEA